MTFALATLPRPSPPTWPTNMTFVPTWLRCPRTDPKGSPLTVRRELGGVKPKHGVSQNTGRQRLQQELGKYCRWSTARALALT